MRYSYNGPVKEFDSIISNRWNGETIANSEKKAKSNLAYQYKICHNKAPSARISLPGKLVVIR